MICKLQQNLFVRAKRSRMERPFKRLIEIGCSLRAFATPLLLLLLLIGSMTSFGQTTNGIITGNVVDGSGASIPNAKVTVKSEGTGFTLDTVSTSAGDYRFPSLAIGRYTITTTAVGFKDTINTGVEVRVGSTTAFDITLTVGNVNETVTVNSDAPQVETQSSEVSGTVDTKQIIDLPLALGGIGALRSPEAFIFLIPGTTGPGTANTGNVNGQSNGIFQSKIGGGQNFAAEVLLDGASQTRSENGSSFDEESPSVEAISEFKVTTSTPQAEFGRTTGGVENFVTKSGSNQYHGSVFDIFKNEALDANDWFNNGNQAYQRSVGNAASAASFARPSDKQNDYGGSLGGPVAIPHIYNGHDKSFFFFAWEQFHQIAGGTNVSTVPDLAERSGNFQDQLTSGATGQINPCDGTAIQGGQIFDPATTRVVNGIQCRSAFPNNIIPAGRFSKQAQQLLSYYPLPTTPALVNNYSLRTSSLISNTTYTLRIDQSISEKDKVFGSYTSRQNTRNNPTFAQLPGFVDPNTQIQNFVTHFGRGGWDHTFSPNVLNHFNIGYNRSNSLNQSPEALSGTNYAAQLGIAGIPTGFPRINIAVRDPNVPEVDSLSRNQNGDNVDNGLRINDAVSWQKGRNSFKFGFDYRYQQYSAIAQDNENGIFNFTGNQTKATFQAPFSNGTGLGFASFLLGNFDTAGVTIPSHQPRWLSNYYAGFAQDDIKVSNTLVVNLGIRYDIDQPRKEALNNSSNFSPTAIDPHSGIPGALVFGTTCNCNTRFADTYFKDIAPRIGFAFAPAQYQGKLSIRGGFATLYGPLVYSDFGGAELTGYTNPINQNSNGFDANFSIDNGLAPYPLGANLDPGFYDNGNSAAPRNFSNYIEPGFGRPAQINQWNLQVQQEVAKDLILTIGYIGSAGSHLKSQLQNINNTSPNTFGLGDILSRPFAISGPARNTPLPYATFNTTAQYAQALRPFPQYDFIATDCCLQNVGHSSYEAAFVSVERRLRQGLTLQASYTYSKDITNADSAINVTNGVSQVQNTFNSKAQKSLSNQDIPQTLVLSPLYELPIGKGKPFLNFKNSVVRSAISGFEVGGVLRYQSGEPVSFAGATGIPGYQNQINFDRVQGSQLASRARRGRIDPFRELRAGGNLAGPDPNVDSEYNGLLQPAGVNTPYSALQTAPAFIDQNQAQNRLARAVNAGGCPTCDNGGFQLGNVPRVTGEVRNYSYKNEDISILKRTPFGENKSFVLKADLLDAFNRHVFGNPSAQPNDRFFGVPTFVINGPRRVQFTARIQF